MISKYRNNRNSNLFLDSDAWERDFDLKTKIYYRRNRRSLSFPENYKYEISPIVLLGKNKRK